MRDVDYRVLQLYDADVRKDKKRLAAVLDDIWKLLPEPATFQEQLQKEKMAKHLVWFITLDTPADPRERLVRGGGGAQVKSMVIHIGLPAVPALLSQLRYPLSDTEDARIYRMSLASCLVEIYNKGGDGRKMAVERIKMYAEGFRGEEKQRVLSALEYTVLKPSPPPVDRSPKK
jgi:hypothetical protein